MVSNASSSAEQRKVEEVLELVEGDLGGGGIGKERRQESKVKVCFYLNFIFFNINRQSPFLNNHLKILFLFLFFFFHGDGLFPVRFSGFSIHIQSKKSHWLCCCRKDSKSLST